MHKMDGQTDQKPDGDRKRTLSLICSTFNKVIWKITAQYIKASRRKVRKTVYFKYSSPNRGIAPTENDAN